MNQRKRVGILGGSFNPIHIGHLALANYIAQYENIDEVWFMVTPQNPLKDNNELLPQEERLELVKISTQEVPFFKASDFEFNLPKPSYTANTLIALKQEYPKYDFSLIIGSDNWEIFPKWKSANFILQNFPILIYPRIGYPIPTSLPKSVQAIHAPIIEISSTAIRKAKKKKKLLPYYMHHKAYQLILKNGWYQ